MIARPFNAKQMAKSCGRGKFLDAKNRKK